ncbi:MAG TPA: hypothetical protein VK915_12240 [Gaiellaceae bacterium]|nr:hypothetical protein [Gaiellaceae bacterium]
MAIVELWTFSIATPLVDLSNVDLTGFEVEARDGGIGKVDEATHEAGGSFVVVDTGPWIFGRKVMLPAGVIRDVDLDGETVFADLTKDEIKNAPEFDEEAYREQRYRSELGDYYRARQQARGRM